MEGSRGVGTILRQSARVVLNISFCISYDDRYNMYVNLMVPSECYLVSSYFHVLCLFFCVVYRLLLLLLN